MLSRRTMDRWPSFAAVFAVVLIGCTCLWPATAGARGASPQRAKPPNVTEMPASVTVEEGQPASFSSAATGAPTPTLQWELSTDSGASWHPVPGATLSPLTIASTVTAESGDEYRAAFTNEGGTSYSRDATLTVRRFPYVIEQPIGATVEAGHDATFEASGGGFPAPTVQWQSSSNGGLTWRYIEGATSDVLTVTNVTNAESGTPYRAVFANAAGLVVSQVAVLTVQEPPHVSKQPVDKTVLEGQNASFEATASGFPAASVQWEVSSDGGVSWSAVPGAQSDLLTITAATASQSGYEYRATFHNPAGNAVSHAATLTVSAAPAIVQQPEGATAEAGESASFEALASGAPLPTPQWERSTDHGATWSAIPGATSDQLTIADVQVAEAGYEFRATFQSSAGSATTAPAVLTVASTRYSALAWGMGSYGELGDGLFSEPSDVPVQVHELSFVTAVAAGLRHGLALLADGTVMAWGSDTRGQLGEEGASGTATPIPVEGLSGVKAIAAGGNSSYALLSNGTVWAWGDNESGQLGDGNDAESEVPVEVKGLSGVTAISAGEEHVLALLSNGTVVAWGNNESGQLGTGSTKSTNVPFAVKGLSGIAAVAAGGEFSLALTEEGSVVGWGSDQYGQLSNPTVEEGLSETPMPVAAGTLVNVKAISAGHAHALALLDNETVEAWGEDAYGELGNGTIGASQEAPVAVSSLSGVTAISAGNHDSAALLGSGSVKTWGIDKWGNLGDGVIGEPSPVPVSVVGVSKVAGVSAGGFHMLGFGEPIPTVSTVTPAQGPNAGGATVTIEGGDLTGASAVMFGGVAAKSFVVDSAEKITATSPAGTGTVDVTVTTPTGTSTKTAADHYTYLAPPTVAVISAKSGPATGGTALTITGAGFNGATAVHFGAAAAPAGTFTVTSASTIAVTSPPSAVAGDVYVTVTGPGGTSAPAKKGRFAYAPVIESLSPSSGPSAGATSVTVTGIGFATAAKQSKFRFGGAKVKTVSCTSSTTCTVITPKGSPSTVDVSVEVAKATSAPSAGDRYTYE